MSFQDGLTLTVPNGSVCGLYSGVPGSFKHLDPEKVIPATNILEESTARHYYYAALEPGLYHWSVSMEGCSTLCQTLLYTPEKAGMQLRIQPEPLAGNGYEPGFVLCDTQEFIDAQLPSSKDAWGAEFASLFQTPLFLRSADHKGRHQQTTQEEMLAFIRKLSRENAHMHIFSLGASPKYGFDMPLVLFTRKNVAGLSLEEAARVIRSNKKPTVQYSAQCHGNEPVSCEGALATMLQLCGDLGTQVLEQLDVYIIPRINPDGARDVMRHSPTTKEDMNRDYLRVHNREIEAVIGAYNLFLPEIALDGHEKRHSVLCAENSMCTDMELQVGAGSLNHPAEMTSLAMTMALEALEKGRSFGLRTHFYAKLASAAGGSAGSSYFGTRNSLSFLVETPGQTALGNYFMERRVFAQYVFASTMLRYAATHSKEIMDTVHASREKMVRSGALYDEADVITLEHERLETGHWSTPLIHVPTGQVADPDYRAGYTEHMISLRSRPRATAYVIAQGLAQEAEILRVAGCHKLNWYRLDPGCSIKLRQYIREEDGVSLSGEETVFFEKGAIVFPNTVASTVLGVIMEPDFNQISGRKMTLLSMGLIEADPDGYLPVYRYCHDLEDGKVVEKA